MKICSRCEIEQPISSFYPIKGKGKYRPYCKECCAKLSKEYKQQHKERLREARKVWRKANPGTERESARARYKTNPEKYRESSRAWKKANPEKHREICRKGKATRRIWQANNQQRIKETNLLWLSKNEDRHRDSVYAWRSANPEKYRETVNRSSRKRLSTPMGKLSNAIHAAISGSLKGKKGYQKWRSLVGYTLDQLKCHLEKKFDTDMTWDNYGQWHVDHKIPISVFNYETPKDIDFKKCWALSNLQPLWAKENISKNAKLKAPFQPSLTLSA